MQRVKVERERGREIKAAAERSRAIECHQNSDCVGRKVLRADVTGQSTEVHQQQRQQQQQQQPQAQQIGYCIHI